MAPVSSASAPKPPKNRKGNCWESLWCYTYISVAGSSGLPPWCRTRAWPPPCSRWSRASSRTRRLDSVLQRLRVGLFACRRFVRTRRPRLDAEQQGNPKTTQFFIPCFLSVTFSILSRSLPQAFFSQPSGFRDEPFDRTSWTPWP